ncbi:hypothetical protein GmHk_14G041947 [Glycine max]|nr:hypothetical protein GmHk_14G041947 [Glycine max]
MLPDEDIPNLAMKDSPSMIVLWLHLSMERFIHLRLQQRITRNNLVTLGLHREQFQKIIRKCLGKPKMKIKCHIGLEIVFETICYHIGMHLSIVPSVHRQKKKWASKKGACMHTSSSISLQDHPIRMSEELGRPVYVDEVFQQTHLRKDTGQFVDDRSRRIHVRPLSLIFFAMLQGPKRKLFVECQETTTKDVERAFGVLKSQFTIICDPSRA